MKKAMLSLSVISAMLFTACDDKKEEKKEEKKAETPAAPSGYYVIEEGSQIGWKGEKRDEEDNHYGTISLTGDIQVKEGAIVNATVFANLSSVKATDLASTPEKEGYLVGHFMGQDFFAAAEGEEAKNPSFEFKGMEGDNAMFTATMRGVSVDVSIPVKVEITADEVRVTSGEFTLDFLPFNMPFFAQEKEAVDGKTPTILAKDVKFSGLNLVAKVQK
jgi:polyisoprenoid-binding protein YceI